GNNSGQVGKNLIFSAGGIGRGDFYFKDFTESQVKELQTRGPFVNRALQDWYVIDDPKLGRIKGGTVDFLHEHPNPIRKANKLKYGDQGKLVWGQELKDKLEFRFNEMKQLQFEVFNDWLPTDDCFVSLDPKVKDKWGLPVAKVRIGNHEHDIKVGKYLAEKSELLLKEMGARNITSSISGSPPPNLMAGGCRFGDNPKFSVLNKNCQLHDAENVFVTDGSFMPTGGSVTYTWTIYANSFRVADIIKSSL
ncbi:MAG: oxidoreductase, partial [Bacteroidetes bacterium]|nr:oxidoreductase [Bacteroidota bacterium]